MHTESIPDFTEWLAPRGFFPMPVLDDNERSRFMGLGPNDMVTLVYYKTGVTNGTAADSLWSEYLQERMREAA